MTYDTTQPVHKRLGSLAILLFAIGIAVTLWSSGAMAASWTPVNGSIRIGLGLHDHGHPVAILQGDLAQFGYNPGPIDGYFGWQTVTALQAFQHEHGLPQSGWLDRSTFYTVLGVGGWSTGGSPSSLAGNAAQPSGSSQAVARTGLRAVSAPVKFIATAYGPNLIDNYPYGPVDYFGQPLKMGDIAVDPSVIPLGTHVWVSGYTSPYLPQGGFEAVARDEGGAIKGRHIDIFINAPRAQVSNFGIQNVTVTVLGK